MSFRTFCIVFFSVASVLFTGGALYQGLLVDAHRNDRGAHLIYAESFDFSKTNETDVIPLRGIGEPPGSQLSVLTGQERVFGSPEEVVIGVMIDEAIGARAHFSGLEWAKVFFEMPAEGGIPRILALFSSDDLPDRIGPVRSARPYFIEMAQQVASVYVHAGGSPEALEMLQQTHMVNIDEGSGDSYFVRDEDIPRPHNLFIIPETLLSEESNDFSPQPLFPFGNQQDVTDPELSETIEIDYPNSSHSVSYSYSLDDGCYIRSQYLETADICPNTVLVLKTDIWGIENDPKNRLNVRTMGSGDMFLFSQGSVTQGTWQRKENSGFVFADEGGQEIRILPGKTFVHVLGMSESLLFSSSISDEDIGL